MSRIAFSPSIGTLEPERTAAPASQAVVVVQAAEHAQICALMGGEQGVLDERHLTDLLRIARSSPPDSGVIELIKAINGFDAVFVKTLAA